MKRILLAVLVVAVVGAIGAGFYILDSKAQTQGFDIFAASPADGGTVTLTWINPGLEYKFIKIFQSDSEEERGQLIQTIEDPAPADRSSLIVKNISPKAAYFFTLAAERSSGHETVLGKVRHLASVYPSTASVATTDPDGRPVIRIFTGENSMMAEIYPYEPEHKGAIEITRADLDGDGSQEIIVAPKSQSSTVKVFRESGQLVGSVEVYEKGFAFGVTVEPVNFYRNGTAVNFFAVAPLKMADAKGKSHPVKIYRYEPAEKSIFSVVEQFVPYPGHGGGLNMTAGDFTGDGYDELAVTPVGGLAEIRLFHYCTKDMVECAGKYGAQRISAPEGINDKIFPYGRTEKQNIKVEAFDFDRDGKEEMIIYPMAGRSSVVKIFGCQVQEGYRCIGKQLAAKQIYGDRFKGGVNVTAFEGKRNEDRYVLISPQKSGGPHFKLYRWDKNNLQQVSEFFAYDKNFTGGVSAAAYKFDGQDGVSVITAPQSNGGTHLKVIDYLTGAMIRQFFAFSGDKPYISIK